MNNVSMRHIPAEWEVDGDILMAWPHDGTDWRYMLEEVHECYTRIIKALTGQGIRVILLTPDGKVDPSIADIDKSLLIPVSYLTDDTWTRDYGPVSFSDRSYADFQFNGWGMKFGASRDNLATMHLRDAGVMKGHYISCLDFVLEGGSIESDGKGTILTTTECLMSLNRNGGKYTPGLKEEIRRRLCADRVLYINHGFLAGDDTDSHVDTLARFAPGDTILYVGCDNPQDEHFTALQAMKHDLMQMHTADGRHYNLIELPMPDPIHDEEGNRLPATYANFLVTPRALFLPVYGQPKKDRLAEQIMQIAFEMPVVTVDCRALIQQHGSLHCATMQIPKELMSI